MKVGDQAARERLAQQSSNLRLRRQQRKARVALAPRTLQNIPERFNRDPINVLRMAQDLHQRFHVAPSPSQLGLECTVSQEAPKMKIADRHS